MFEAVEPFKLHPHIHGIHILGARSSLTVVMDGCFAAHIHTITTTDVIPDLVESAEILGDVSVQTIPPHYGWGCRTFQTLLYG